MKLTEGKCLNEFEKWFYEKYNYSARYGSDISKQFYPQQLEMQIGVYQLYFDSVGIDTGTVKNHTGTFNNWAGHSIRGAMDSVKTREQAWKQAVERANKIREKQLNKL